MENVLKVEHTYKKLKENPKRKYERRLKAFIQKGKTVEYLIPKRQNIWFLTLQKPQ